MIKYKHGGIVHRLAFCKDCDWEDALDDMGGWWNLINAAKRHCKETGHTIDIETGTVGKVLDF